MPMPPRRRRKSSPARRTPQDASPIHPECRSRRGCCHPSPPGRGGGASVPPGAAPNGRPPQPQSPPGTKTHHLPDLIGRHDFSFSLSLSLSLSIYLSAGAVFGVIWGRGGSGRVLSSGMCVGRRFGRDGMGWAYAYGGRGRVQCVHDHLRAQYYAYLICVTY